MPTVLAVDVEAPRTTSPRPLRKDAARNRELLLAAAGEVFSELGLDAGVEEVARRAGVGMGTLYRRFPTKDALVDELAHHLLAGVTSAAADAAARGDGTATEGFLVAVGEQFARHGGLLCRLWAGPQRKAEIAGLRATMADIVARDQSAGTLRPEITSADLSLVLWGLQGIVETATSAAPAAWRRHVDLMLAGMSVTTRRLATRPVSRVELDAISHLRTQR